ncbi:hypothetical protein SADUNF_Sadunf04G0005800 [Salix dunnii]|uniref:Uncharacterized protein n=1 Tax=Salix dunnii TaxID=1413687 RepID=A0A835K677_9ROSI|nr:hypothetical protein SADUNF_Sadunf04G0005800 [Salix dunnii]
MILLRQGWSSSCDATCYITRQSQMRSKSEDLLPDRGKQLIVPESVLLVNPINTGLKGEIDDKYQYSMDNKDGGVHGWISSGPIIGFWTTFPSHELENNINLVTSTGLTLLRFDCVSYRLPLEVKSNLPNTEQPDQYRVLRPTTLLLVESYLLFCSKLRFVSESLIPAKKAYAGLSTVRTEGAWTINSGLKKTQMEIAPSRMLSLACMDSMAGFLVSLVTNSTIHLMQYLQIVSFDCYSSSIELQQEENLI